MITFLLRLQTLLLAVIVQLDETTADLPIHCTLQDVAGDWVFYLSPAQPVDHKIPECGHSTPNSVSAMLSINQTDVVPHSRETEVHVSLTEEIVTKPERHLRAAGTTAGENGSWTMVFDTGLEVRIGGVSLASHFYFEVMPNASRGPEDGDALRSIGEYHGRQGNATLAPMGKVYACHCDTTSVGWWHRRGAGGLEAGCLWGRRAGPAAPV
eukprot:CAMPEP_0168389218 /NCGR_PEP_ID=MMETSP0228-20121227/16853_1 /TAXON_ID=133427 /ORGANISM="Protoceratium reticulatum, Strain CCCM 535 (=CCMP 1889)" /LENGTH=210 /DNA_ID=CAMNT_0008402489 /DNA_START=70 /DNA_END=699 /DNA_ORIENTATION=-